MGHFCFLSPKMCFRFVCHFIVLVLCSTHIASLFCSRAAASIMHRLSLFWSRDGKFTSRYSAPVRMHAAPVRMPLCSRSRLQIPTTAALKHQKKRTEMNQPAMEPTSCTIAVLTTRRNRSTDSGSSQG